MVRRIRRDLRPGRDHSCGHAFSATAVPWLVGLYITAAYWFTASTSFANPAVAIARAFTNTFSGIRPIDLPGFIVAQVLGAVCALALTGWLLNAPTNPFIRSKLRPSYDGHDLPQPELRHVPNHPRDDPPERNSASQIPNGARTS